MELSEYIALDQGTYESSGQFTLDPAQLVEKLSRFLLSDDNHGLLKLIQGCVGWGAREIWVSAGARDLTLYATIDEARQHILDIHARFSEVFVGMPDSPERDLLMGICHFLHHKPESVGLSRWKEGKLETWDILVGDAPKSIRRYPKGMKSGLGIHVYLSKKAPPFKLVQAEWSKLCFFAPLPIHAEGRVLNGPCPFNLRHALLEYFQLGRDKRQGRISPRYRGKAEINLGIDLNWANMEAERQSSLVQIRSIGLPDHPPDQVTSFTSTTSGILEALRKPFEHSLPYCTGCLYLDRKVSDKAKLTVIYPVKRGVILEPFSVELPAPGALVFLASDDIPTDISTRKAHEDASAELIHRAMVLVKEGVEICHSNHDKLLDDIVYADPASLAPLVPFSLAFMAVGALAFSAPMIVPGLLGTACVALHFRNNSQTASRRGKAIDDLQSDIRSLNQLIDRDGF